MKTQFRRISSLLVVYGLTVLLSACAGEQLFDQLVLQSSSLSGGIVVAGAATLGTAPGTIALFDSNGTLVRQLRDHYIDTELTKGLAVFGGVVFGLVDGADRIEAIKPLTGATSVFSSSPQISGVLRHMVVDTAGYLYVLENNSGTANRGQIEKLDPSGQRVGSPFVNSDTTGPPACALQFPYGIDYIPTLDQIVVVNNSAGNLLFFNASSGACVASVTGANFTAGNPTGVAYHAATNKILITKAGTDTIIAANVNGTSPATVYNNTARILDPYAIAVDSAGYVYVGATGQDAVEKFSFDGTTLTPVTGGPLIQTGIYVQNPGAIAIIP